MFTVCPKCALSLIVTAADLKVAQGFVRCGRCSNVFNAIAALSDEQLATPEPSPEAPAVPESLPIPPDISLEFNATAADVSKIFIEPAIGDETTGTFETIVLQSDEPDVAEPVMAPSQPSAPSAPVRADSDLDDELRSLAERVKAQEPPSGQRTAAASASPPPAAAPTALSARSTLEADALSQFIEAPGREPTRRRWAWRAAATMLLAVLVFQAVNHYRNSLAVYAPLHGPLTKIYRALGVPLVPRWDLAAYDVRQLGADSSSAGADWLVVRASVQNAAPRAQPLPLLRMSVQDRFGNRIAARDVAPAAYLPRGVPTSGFLSAGQRVDAELRFVDPGPEAVGFEIDACLPAEGGGVACANAH